MEILKLLAADPSQTSKQEIWDRYVSAEDKFK